MKKYLILLALPFLFACGGGNKKTTPLEDSLAVSNEKMVDEIDEKDTIIRTKEVALSEFVKSFNEIQDNLNQIKAKERILNENKKGVELNKSAKDQIISDIKFIYHRMNKNKHKLSSVTKKLKESNIKIDELETAIVHLNVQIIDNEREITELKQRLEKLNIDFGNLQEVYTEEKTQSEEKTEQLNTAYYTIGTAKYLKKNGIITQEGGFIGIGKTMELNKNFNSINFTRVDIRTVIEIPLNEAKKVKLITQHPTDSYKFVEGKGYEKLVILDPKKFWEASKYLVIEAEK